METRKDNRLPKVRYWDGSQSRRTDGHWHSALFTREGNSLRVREKDGRCVDGGINWPNERPTAARRLMDRKIGKACRSDLTTEFYTSRGPSSFHGSMGSWIHGFMDDGSERRPTLMWWR